MRCLHCLLRMIRSLLRACQVMAEGMLDAAHGGNARICGGGCAGRALSFEYTCSRPCCARAR